jgi:Spy/CpxP family protein refolding chaperone
MKLVKILIASSVITACVLSLTLAAAGGGGAERGTGRWQGLDTSTQGFGLRAGDTSGGIDRFGILNRGGNQPARSAVSLQDLTDDQTKKLTALVEADTNSFQKAQNALTSANSALTAAEISVDDAKIKEAYKAVASATEVISDLRMAQFKKVKAILTDEQYKQLQQNLTSPRGSTRRGTGTTPGTRRGTTPRIPRGGARDTGVAIPI